MKLSDWAKTQGISYLTAYRWFKNGTLPVKAYQSDSGTIIVQDDLDTLEQMMSPIPQASNDAMSLFLKKTVEFSKNNSTVEDFAAYVLSNFSLKLNNGTDSPKYSRNKPKSEEIQNHFKKFIPDKKEKPKPNMFVAGEEMLEELVAKADDLTKQELVGEIQKYSETDPAAVAITDAPEFKDLIKDLWHDAKDASNPNTLYDISTDGVINRNVELSPQQINYTSSSVGSLSSNFSGSVASNSMSVSGSGMTSGLFLSDSPTDFPSTYYSSQASVLGSSPIQTESKTFRLIDKPKRGRPRKK